LKIVLEDKTQYIFFAREKKKKTTSW